MALAVEHRFWVTEEAQGSFIKIISVSSYYINKKSDANCIVN
jgi:hypothetical protein